MRTGLDEQHPLRVKIVDREEVHRDALSAGRLVWEDCALFPKSLVSFTRRKDLVPISIQACLRAFSKNLTLEFLFFYYYYVVHTPLSPTKRTPVSSTAFFFFRNSLIQPCKLQAVLNQMLEAQFVGVVEVIICVCARANHSCKSQLTAKQISLPIHQILMISQCMSSDQWLSKTGTIYDTNREWITAWGSASS
jgi:hypothetical protein